MDTMHVPLWLWGVTIAALVLLVSADLVLTGRRAQRPRLRETAWWTLGTVALAVAFGAALGAVADPAASGQFFAGWMTEYSLSLDNLFVFVLLIGRSAVPGEQHGRVLLLGIVFALLLRGIFIALGAAALSRFGWVMYLFGAFLLITAGRIAVSRRAAGAGAGLQAGGAETSDTTAGGGGGAAMRLARRIIPVSPVSAGGRLTTRIGGRRYATPALILIVAIATTDLIFALDSIPAIFGLTRDPYLVFTANVFALLGLRHLYFLIGGLLARLVHLSAGLSIILGFIGLKLITEALAASGVHQIGPLPVPQIGTGVSLAVIVGVIAVVTVTSLLASRRLVRPPPARR